MMTGGDQTSQKTRPRTLLFPLLCVLGVTFNIYLTLPVLPYVLGGDNDFMGFYAGARLAGSGGLYDQAKVQEIESATWQRPRTIAFVRLPFYAVFISPLRLFSYQVSYRIWQALSLCAIMLFVYFWPTRDRWVTAAACCWSIPLFNCFVMGQDATVVLLLIALVLATLFRGRKFVSGLLLSLCSIKYNLFLTLPLFLLKRRDARLTGGLLTGGVVLLAICFLASGWSWPQTYVSMLRLPATTPHYEGLPNLHGMVYGHAKSFWLEAAGVCVVVLCAWIALGAKEIRHAIAALLIGGLLLSYHAFFADGMLMLPAGLLLIDRGSGVLMKIVGFALLCPVTYIQFSLPSPMFHPAAVFLTALIVLSVLATARGAALVETLGARIANPEVYEAAPQR